MSVFAGDVVKPDVTEAMADFTMKTYGRIDILHNNVGIGGVPGTPETVALEGWNTRARNQSDLHDAVHQGLPAAHEAGRRRLDHHGVVDRRRARV